MTCLKTCSIIVINLCTSWPHRCKKVGGHDPPPQLLRVRRSCTQWSVLDSTLAVAQAASVSSSDQWIAIFTTCRRSSEYEAFTPSI